MEKLNRLLHIPLTNDQLCSALGCSNSDIILYGDLRNYETIEDLLPTINSYKIILIEEVRSRGHWTCIFKTKDGYFYFNSYGNTYDKGMPLISRMMKCILHENVKEITRLLHGQFCEHNPHKFQGPKTDTCGRWVIIAISYMVQMGFDIVEFYSFLNNQKQISGLSFDLVVCKLCPI